jgi:hypothetical protein
MTPITQPMIVFDERRAINRLAGAVALIRDRLNQERGMERLEAILRRSLHAGDLGIASKAVEAADKGDSIADAALRAVAAELQPSILQRRELAPGHLQIIAYLQRVASRAPLKRKPGRYPEHGAFYRNVGICALVQLACAEFDVRPTRNRADRRARRQPSGISLVVAALARNRINLAEKTIQDEIWFGLPGALARKAVEERHIEEFFPYPDNS